MRLDGGYAAGLALPTMSRFEFRLLFGGAVLIPAIGLASSWWMAVIAAVLYAIAATIILRPILQRVREAREKAKREMLSPKDWLGHELK